MKKPVNETVKETVKKTCVLVGLSFVVVGCDRTHLSASFGVANRTAFHAQVIDPNAGNAARPDQPLDPEEAAIIAHTYQKSLAPKETADQTGGASPLLVTPPPAPPNGTGAPR